MVVIKSPDEFTSFSSDKYDYNQMGSKAKRVGQAVVDILSGPCEPQTVGETLDAYGPDYAKAIEECVEENLGRFSDPFYVFVITKKEFWAENVVRNWFIARQTPPHAFNMMEQYYHHTKTLYIVNARKGQIKICWSLPGYEDCICVAKNPHLYSPELVSWIEQCFTRKLDKDSYSFDD